MHAVANVLLGVCAIATGVVLAGFGAVHLGFMFDDPALLVAFGGVLLVGLWLLAAGARTVLAPLSAS